LRRKDPGTNTGARTIRHELHVLGPAARDYLLVIWFVQRYVRGLSALRNTISISAVMRLTIEKTKRRQLVETPLGGQIRGVHTSANPPVDKYVAETHTDRQ
jgi:hypothetical protein